MQCGCSIDHRLDTNTLRLRGQLQHGQGEQQHAAQAQIAVFGGVPLGLSVRAAAIAAGAHGESRNAERERNIGVGRAQAQIGAQAEMAIDGAQSFQQRRIGGQLRGGPVADLVD